MSRRNSDFEYDASEWGDDYDDNRAKRSKKDRREKRKLKIQEQEAAMDGEEA